MKLEDALIRLNEEELFGKVHSVDIEQMECMKWLGDILGRIEKYI